MKDILTILESKTSSLAIETYLLYDVERFWNAEIKWKYGPLNYSKKQNFYIWVFDRYRTLGWKEKSQT